MLLSPSIISAHSPGNINRLDPVLNVPEILDKPGQIYNMDETGMTLDPTKLKAVFAKGTQNPSCISSTTKSHR